MQHGATSTRVERSEYSDAGGHFEVMAGVTAVTGVGMAVSTTLWLKASLAYWPALLALYAIYALVMLWLTRNWVPKQISRALSTEAVISPGPVAGSAVFPCVYLVVGAAVAGLLIANFAPTLMGFTSVQLLVFSAIGWQGARAIRKWEERSGSRLLVRPRLPANRSDFLIQSTSYPS